MSGDRTFPKNTPRWLIEVRTYWAALSTERAHSSDSRSTESRQMDDEKSSRTPESSQA